MRIFIFPCEEHEIDEYRAIARRLRRRFDGVDTPDFLLMRYTDDRVYTVPVPLNRIDDLSLAELDLCDWSVMRPAQLAAARLKYFEVCDSICSAWFGVSPHAFIDSTLTAKPSNVVVFPPQRD